MLASFLGRESVQKLQSLLLTEFTASDTDQCERLMSLTTQTFEHYRNGRLSLSSFPLPTKDSVRPPPPISDAPNLIGSISGKNTRLHSIGAGRNVSIHQAREQER
jgi:hypothetical protein